MNSHRHASVELVEPQGAAAPMANHVHWIYWAYKSRDGDNLREVVAIDVMADSEADALKKAKGLYKLTGRESGYMLKNVIEHLGDSCGH